MAQGGPKPMNELLLGLAMGATPPFAVLGLMLWSLRA